MLRVVVPFGVDDILTASVTVTPLDEFAALHMTTNGQREFAAKKQRVKDKLVFAPGKYVFKGMKGEEGDVEKYEVNHTEATNDAGPLRIVARSRTGFFMVGPSAKGEYKTFFHSALQKDVKERGFCLTAGGAPEKANHWVRFTDFRVVKE